MQKRRWAIVVAAVLVAGVAVTAALATNSRSTAGKTFYFIPKDTLNPYEVIADRGGKIALTKLGVAVFPEDVAEAIAFFAGPRSAKSTGNVVNVDGGVTAAYPR